MSKVISFAPFRPGDVVGAHRWPKPLSRSNPPHSGVVLAENDPIAWQGTIAFGDRLPGQEEVDAHVAWYRSEFAKRQPSETPSIPVLWSFPDGKKVIWSSWGGQEDDYGLRSYEDDVRRWKLALHEAELENARRSMKEASHG